jgi:uncharacterized protein (TIGR02391 family)
MVKRSTPPPPTAANLSPAQMIAALPLLEQRDLELREFEQDGIGGIVDYDDLRVESLRNLYNDTLIEIFGPNTIEYERYSMSSFYLSNASSTMVPDFGGRYHGPDVGAIRTAYGNGIRQALMYLGVIKKRFNEKLTAAGATPGARAARAFGDLDIHPKIAAAAEKLVAGGYHANAVEDACKALQSVVQQKSNCNLDGKKLMERVFSLDNPILVVGDLTTETGRNEQHGMLMMASGAMMFLRNPRAHELRTDEPGRAIEYIAFLSMLAKIVDEVSL